METEKKPNDTTSTEEKENPLLQVPEMNRPNYIQIYIPTRTCIVLVTEENESKYDLTKLIY